MPPPVSPFSPSPHSSRPPLVVGFWRTTVCSAAALAIHLTTIFLHFGLFPKRKSVIFPPSILGIIAAILALSSSLIHVHLWKKSNSKTLRQWWKIEAIVQQSICFFSFIAVLAAITILTLGGIGSQLRYTSYFDLTSPPRTVLAAFVCLGIIADAALGAIVARLTWWPVHRAALSSMTISSVLLLVVGTLLVNINRAPLVDCDQVLLKRLPSTIFSLHQQTGAIISALGILGIAVCCAIKEGNRINVLLTRFIYCYLFLASITVLLCVVIVVLSLILLRNNAIKPIAQRSTIISDPVLAGTSLFLIIINLIAANYLQAPPASHLAVEDIDLSALTPAQRDAYAARINLYGKQVPGAPNGDAAIALMQAYASATLSGANCRVLRVYRPPTSVHKLMRRVATYEDDHAWQKLDEEKMVLRQEVLPSDTESKETVVAPPPKLSKYQQKKLARKQAAAAAAAVSAAAASATDSTSTIVPSPVSEQPPISPSTLQANLAFTAKLESTEALVLLTTIDDYDLTAGCEGWAGRLLQRTLGKQSFAKPLCVRLGLLAFHYPFRQSTFYCSPARRPVARSAAVLRAIAEWNQQQGPTRRCTMLLDPTYQHEAAERAIAPSGWQRMPLPASHIVDLRAHKGQSLAEYLRAIRYRDQEGAFRKAGGVVVESRAFAPEECAEEIRLWRQIAEKRVAEGNTAALATPDERFLAQLGEGGACSLMFLKVAGGDSTVASCVLFRLGDTITSDLQGLDYERARPVKAYFVMMQHVIATALREGYSFVDFGPTTPKPKLDIGCKSVPMIGAMYALSPFISIAIRIAAGKFTRTSQEQ